MDRGAWRATVHGVAKSWTRLRDLACTACLWVRKRVSHMLNTQDFIESLPCVVLKVDMAME